MSDQLAVLKFVASRLEAADIEYMVTGSIAAGHYGQPRMTRDIDVVVALLPPHARRFATLLAPECLCDADTVAEAIASRRTFNVMHRDALQKIDFIVRSDSDFEFEKFERRRRVDIDGQPVWLISPEDLILSKLVWTKGAPFELQLRDVGSILALQPHLDRAYLDRWALRLTVAELLKELR